MLRKRFKGLELGARHLRDRVDVPEMPGRGDARDARLGAAHSGKLTTTGALRSSWERRASSYRSGEPSAARSSRDARVEGVL